MRMVSQSLILESSEPLRGSICIHIRQTQSPSLHKVRGIYAHISLTPICLAWVCCLSQIGEENYTRSADMWDHRCHSSEGEGGMLEAVALEGNVRLPSNLASADRSKEYNSMYNAGQRMYTLFTFFLFCMVVLAPRSGLKRSLEAIGFILAKFEPKPSHGYPIRDPNCGFGTYDMCWNIWN